MRRIIKCGLTLAAIAAPLLAGALRPARAQAPITLGGYNADIITDANKATRFAQPLDIGTAAWFEAGAVDDGGTAHANGLPIGNFTSALTNAVTGGNTVFDIQAANASNALLLRANSAAPNTGTLTLAAPGRYGSLAILAAGYNAGAGSTGAVVLDFADGSQSAPLSFDAFDWGFGGRDIALGGRGRNFNVGADGKAFNYNQPVPFSLYETDLNLAALGLDGRALAALTFTGGTVSDQPGVPNHGPSTSVFAVSGVAVPEPSSLALLGLGLVGPALHARRRPRR